MRPKKNLFFLISYFPALVSGFLLTASFPDFNLYYLAFVALVPLMVSIQSMTSKQSFYAGFVAGFGYYLHLVLGASEYSRTHPHTLHNHGLILPQSQDLFSSDCSDCLCQDYKIHRVHYYEYFTRLEMN